MKLMLRPAIVVWGLWAAMLLLALLYVARYGVNVPYYDEWVGIVPILEGGREIDAAWLWSAHNDHRIPLPKLALLCLYGISGWDVRTGMFASVLLVAAAAALLMRSAAKSRNRTAYTDVLFPLILLNWGHYENFLWGWQVTQVIPVALVLAILATMVGGGLRPSAASGLACGLAVVALPLSGVPGLAYAPGLASWLGLVGWLRWRAGAPGDRPIALALWACAAVSVALVPLYFLHLTTSVRETPELLATVRTMVAFLTLSLGRPKMADSRLASYLIAFVLALGGLSALGMLLVAFRRLGTHLRERAFTLLLFLTGIVGLALSVGVARPGLVSFPPRYYVQTAPALIWIYFVWELSDRPQLGSLVRTSLVAVALAATGLNYAAGLDYARRSADRWDAFLADLKEGLPPSALVARHQRTLLPFPGESGAWGHLSLARGMNALRSTGVGIFVDLAPEGPLREVPITALATAKAERSATLWDFDQPVKLLGLRLVAPRSRAGEGIAPYATIDWRSATAEFAPDRRYHWWTGSEPEALIWIHDDVKELRIDPGAQFDSPSVLVILVAAGAR